MTARGRRRSVTSRSFRRSSCGEPILSPRGPAAVPGRCRGRGRSGRRCERPSRSPVPARHAGPGPQPRIRTARQELPRWPVRPVTRPNRCCAACADPSPIAREIRGQESPRARAVNSNAASAWSISARAADSRVKAARNSWSPGSPVPGPPEGEPDQVGRRRGLAAVPPWCTGERGGTRGEQLGARSRLAGGLPLVRIRIGHARHPGMSTLCCQQGVDMAVKLPLPWADDDTREVSPVRSQLPAP